MKYVRKIDRGKTLHISCYDALTGLYSRMFFEKEINRNDKERKLPISIIIGDINGLKLVNDVSGPLEGDKLICSTADIIKSICIKADMISRWGEDEFIIYLQQTSEKEAEKICKRITEKCSQREEGKRDVSISLGCASTSSIQQDILSVIKEAEDRMHERKLLESKSLRNAMMNLINNALNEKSYETKEHAGRLKNLCRAIGAQMKLSEHDLYELELLAILHDIGKIAINNTVLNKAGKLNEEEWKEMRRHPEAGYRIAKASPDLWRVAEYILTHHERWDGKGYPMKLKGKAIPIASRILAVVDAFDAITNDRAYRSAQSIEKAVEELAKNAGTQFDPEVVDIFVDKVLG